MLENIRTYKFLRIAALVLVLVTTAIFLKWSISGPLHDFAQSQYDDSYITYRYAANAATGNGLVFNVGDETNSASSLLWTLLLIPIYHFFGTNTPQVAQALLLCCNVALAATVFVYVANLWKCKLNLLLAIAASFYVSLAAPTVYWTFSGMETSLFLLLIALGILGTRHVITTEISTLKRITFFAILSLLSICRFEGIALALSLSLFILISKVVVRRYQGSRVFQIADAAPLIVTLASTTLLFLFYKVYYGKVTPDPITFKRLVSYYSQTVFDAGYQILGFFHDWIGIPVLILFSLSIAITVTKFFRGGGYRDKHAWGSLVPLIAFSALGFFILASAFSDYYRYQLVLIVPLTVAIAEGGTEFLKRRVSGLNSPTQHRTSRILPVLALLSVVLVILMSSPNNLNLIASETKTYVYLQDARIELGKYMEAHLKPDSKVLSGDLGALSFYNLSSYYIDSGGLTNRKLLTGLSESKSYSQIIKSQSPEYLADSMLPDGVSGTESMFGDPQKYYDSSAVLVHSGCELHEMYALTKLREYPKFGEYPLYVSLWKLDLNQGAPCSQIN